VKSTFVRIKKGFKVGEWIDRQHGIKFTYHQLPEQSSMHKSSFEQNAPRSITRTETKNKTNRFRGRTDDLRPADINIPETSENQSQKHQLNQF